MDFIDEKALTRDVVNPLVDRCLKEVIPSLTAALDSLLVNVVRDLKNLRIGITFEERNASDTDQTTR